MVTLPTPSSSFGSTGSSSFVGSAPNRIIPAGPWFLTLGDSKTSFHDEQYGHWQDLLVTSLGAASGRTWSYINRGVGSKTVATYRTYIELADTFTTARPDTGGMPAAVLFNIGVNDSLIGPFPLQNAWTTDFLAMIDVVRTFWGSAPIYVMRWWSRIGTAPADADTEASWFAAMIAQRTNVFLGPDERVFLKGSDNGVTNTYDGIHQNAAGMTATAAAWHTVLWT